MVEFRALGRVDLVTNDGRPLTAILAQPKRLALFAYLALATPRGFQRRDRLLALFWPESDDARARGALNQSLYHLRQVLGEDVLVARGDDEIGLNWELCRCDVVELRNAFAEGRFETLVELYRGEVMPGFHANTSPEFEQWLDGERLAAQETARTALKQLVNDAQTRNDTSAVVKWLRQSLVIDPHDDKNVQLLMTALANSGELRAAFTEYERLCGRLADLGAAPSAQLSALAVEIKTRLASDITQSALPGVIAPNPRSPRRRLALTRRLSLAALILVVALIAGFSAYRRSTLIGSGALNERDLMVIADFHNTTPDSALGLVVTESFRVDFSQSRIARVLSPMQMREALRRMRRDSVRQVDGEIARELAVREGAKAVLDGAISSVGRGFVITATLTDPASGNILASFNQNATDESQLIPAIGELSRSVRRRIGEKLSAIRATPPLAQVTTASLPALRAFSQGRAAGVAGNPAEARAFVEVAVRLDTTFAYAAAALANSYFNRNVDYERAIEMQRRAYRYRDHLTDYERFMIEGYYHRRITGQRDQAIQAFLMAKVSAPDGVAGAPLEHLCILYTESGQFAKAEEACRQRIALAGGNPKWPFFPYPYDHLLPVDMLQGKFAEAEADAKRAVQEFEGSYWGLGAVSLARRDYNTAERLYAQSVVPSDQSVPRRRAHDAYTDILQLRGRFREAHSAISQLFKPGEAVKRQLLRAELTRARLDLLVHSDAAAALKRLDTGLRNNPIENFAKAIDRPYAELALLYGLAGRRATARTWAAKMDSATAVSLALAGSPTAWMSGIRGGTLAGIASLLHAMLDLADGQTSEAIAEIRSVMQQDPTCSVCYLTELGMAYEAAGQADSALAVYRQYATSPALYLRITFQWQTPAAASIPFVLMRLAKLNEARNDTAEATRYYREFIELWQNADPDLQPVVKQARATLQRLAARQYGDSAIRLVTTK